MIALIVAIPATIAPVMVAWLGGSQRREEKQLDWKRQDEVTARAEQAAKLLLDSNREIAKTTKVVAEATKEANEKLTVVHGLVNSSYTAALEGQYHATVRELALMREVFRLNERAGNVPNGDGLRAIEATEAKIKDLDAVLKERRAQAEAAAEPEKPK